MQCFFLVCYSLALLSRPTKSDQQYSIKPASTNSHAWFSQNSQSNSVQPQVYTQAEYNCYTNRCRALLQSFSYSSSNTHNTFSQFLFSFIQYSKTGGYRSSKHLDWTMNCCGWSCTLFIAMQHTCSSPSRLAGGPTTCCGVQKQAQLRLCSLFIGER